MKKNCLLILIIPFLWIVSAGAKTNVEKIIKEVQEYYKNAKSAQIEFKEINRFKLTGLESEIFGTLYFKGVNEFRLETEDQVIVSNGEVFWRYNKIEDQVLIDHAKKGRQEVLLNQFLYQISDHYYSQLIEEIKQNDKKVYVINLTPKEADQSYFTSVKIWVEDKTWKIHRVIYTDYNDNQTEYQIEEIEVNRPMQDTLFTFTPPEGANVVDLRF